VNGSDNPGLRDAYRALAQGKTESAEATARRCLEQSPNRPDALYLMGQVLVAKGDFDAGRQYLRTALRHGAAPVTIATALGGVAAARGRFDEALAHYKEALDINAASEEALYGAAFACLELDDVGAARRYLAQARDACPDAAVFDYVEAKILKAEGNTTDAETAYRRLLKAMPNHLHALYECALLVREDGRLEEARTLLDRALRIRPDNPKILFLLGNVCYELGEFEPAERAFRSVLRFAPADVDTHVLLNKLYHDFGKSDRFGKSFEVGLRAAPASLPLRLAMIDTLTRADRIEEALDALHVATRAVGSPPELRARAGRLAMITGDIDQAVEHMRAATIGRPETLEFALAYGEYLITQGDYEAALTELERVEPLAPDSQDLWALRGTAWQLGVHDEEVRWLYGEDAFIATLELDCPEGYASQAVFLEDLKTVLEQLHKTDVAPIDQTLRGGTQTLGRLLDNPDPVIQKYRSALETTVGRYVERLPRDQHHPLARRNTGRFDFSASWSVRLSRGGFHVDHIHPMGWISSACYIAFDPATISADENDPAGWIRFGVPGIRLAGRSVAPLKIVRPEPGLLALFPSYTWHGTYPVKSEGYRLTAPFDAVPA
jgi:tetratricopeptide (TPR) repeat protein